jgi:DNA-binding LacI/PurR family transcriptional regulator
METEKEKNIPSTAPAQFTPRLRAVEGIKRLIRQNTWTIGQRLPAEDTLAEIFSVSRSTIRKALSELESKGWVKREHYHGCVVNRDTTVLEPLTSRTIAVINDTPMSSMDHDDPSDAGIPLGMIGAADSMGLNTLFVYIGSVTDETVPQLVSRGVPGVIILSWEGATKESRRNASLFHKAGIPISAFGMDNCIEAIQHYDRVATDHESGMMQLLHLLSKHGCKHIMRLWTPPPETSWIAEHERAYERLCKPLKFMPTPPVFVEDLPARVIGDFKLYEIRKKIITDHIAKYIKNTAKPDAIMVGSDCETFLVAAACRTLGLKPDIDVLITGYDNYWHSAFEQSAEPSVPFATVDKRNATIGAELVRLLSERMSGNAPSKPCFKKIAQSAFETSFHNNVGNK